MFNRNIFDLFNSFFNITNSIIPFIKDSSKIINKGKNIIMNKQEDLKIDVMHKKEKNLDNDNTPKFFL